MPTPSGLERGGTSDYDSGHHCLHVWGDEWCRPFLFLLGRGGVAENFAVDLDYRSDGLRDEAWLVVFCEQSCICCVKVGTTSLVTSLSRLQPVGSRSRCLSYAQTSPDPTQHDQVLTDHDTPSRHTAPDSMPCWTTTSSQSDTCIHAQCSAPSTRLPMNTSAEKADEHDAHAPICSLPLSKTGLGEHVLNVGALSG